MERKVAYTRIGGTLLLLLIAAVAGWAAASGGGPPAVVQAGPAAPQSCGWSVVSSPNVGTNGNYLVSVAANSASDAVAAGYYFDGTFNQTLIEGWNGAAWTVQTNPAIPGFSSQLSGLSADPGGGYWAVGQYADNQGTHALILHQAIAGGPWTLVPPAAATDQTTLYAVSAAAANDAWAVGVTCCAALQTHIEHWNGTAWLTVPSPSPGSGANFLKAASAVAPNDVWAAGYFNNGGSSPNQTLIEHYNGTAWAVSPSPNVGTGLNYLSGISGKGPTYAWAVGSYSDATNVLHTLTIHWAGTAWTVVPSPDPGANGNVLNGMWGVSPTSIWAVGSGGTGTGLGQPLVEHWDGSAWTGSIVPGVGNNTNVFLAVGGPAGGNPWAAGYYDNAGNVSLTLVEGFVPCGPGGTPTACLPTPTPGGPPPPLPRLQSQPVGKHSALTTWEGPAVQDDEFAAWAGALLAPHGVNNVCDATFLFQECYGGGMLDDLQTALSGQVTWVGGSASTYSQVAWVHNAPVPGGYWTDALLPELVMDQPMVNALVNAAANDQASTWQSTQETPQWTYGNGGELIHLNDPYDHSHHAILWSGDTRNAPWSYALIRDMRAALIHVWGPVGGNVTIDVLFGDGVHQPDGTSYLPPSWGAVSATRDNLSATMARLAAVMGPDEQFFFYSGDHGETRTIVLSMPTPLPPGGRLGASFGLAPGELGGMAHQPNNPETMVFTYTGRLDTAGAAAVGLNGTTLGYLQPGSASGLFSVPAALLRAQDNQVLVQSATSSTLTIDAAEFSTGGISPQILPGPSPTPVSCAIQFSDVPAGSPFYTYIHFLACVGVIGGYGDGTFRPYANVTRGQVSKFVVNAAGLSDPIPPTRQTFEDVPPSYPFWQMIEELAGKGYISGYACGAAPAGPCVAPANRPYFVPGNPVTRGQLAKIVANTAQYAEAAAGELFEDVPASNPFYPYIERVALHSVVSGYACGAAPAGGCVAPGNRPYFLLSNDVTRGQTAKIVANTFYPK